MSEKKRLIADLRVIDLRQELEKRKLDKSGVRAVLLKRLSQFLKDEGHDPDTYTFDPLTTETKPKRGRSESVAEEEAAEAEMDGDAEDALLDVRVEDMIVQDDVGDEDDVDDEKKETPATTEKSSVKLEAMETGTVAEAQSSRKRELKEVPEATAAKKPCLDAAAVKTETAGEEVKAELNNTDAEDSINLDIGEDELLNDDAESSAKVRKAEGAGGDGATQQAAATADAAAPTDDADTKHDEHREVKSDGNTTSEKTDNKDKDETDAKTETDGGKLKEEGKEAVAANIARNLWVSGLSGDTRAKDLKQLFSKHGKVIGAKVVTNARTPGSRCYGYVTMSSAQDADNCIKNLHLTELHGRMVSVEKARSDNTGAVGSATARRSAPSRRSDRREPHRHSSKEKSKDTKNENGEVTKESSENEEGKKGEEEAGEGKARSTSRSRDKRSSDKGAGDKVRRDRPREKKRSPKEVLSFNKIWKERDAARARERSRAAREEERRRRAAEEVLRERERRQRQEKHRLALEREKLRAERERIEREKNELLRLERERHKLEREKLELERLELKRAQLRLEEERRKRGSEYVTGYRKPNSPPPPPPYERDARHKRPPPPPLSSSRSGFEAPPPPRFEMVAPAYERSGDKRGDYKRDYNPRHISSSSVKYPSNGTSADDSRQPIPPGTRPKEPAGRAGYEAREGRGAAYRTSPPSKPEPRQWSASSRYPDSSAPAKEYSERGGSGSSGWTGGSAGKSYSSSRHAPPAVSTSQSWSKPGSSSNASETWQSSSGGGGGGGGGGESRYSSNYEARSYPAAYQPPPPGAAPYVDRYQAPARGDYRQKY